MENADQVAKREDNLAAAARRATKLRIIAVLLLIVPPVAHILIRRFVPVSVVLGALAVLVALLVLLWLLTLSSRRARAGADAPRAKKDLFWYAYQTERWRQNLSIMMLFAIGALCLLLVAGGFLLMVESKPFLALIVWLSPGVSFLVVLTISIVAVFAGAASLGPRLIRLITGRMPLGRP